MHLVLVQPLHLYIKHRLGVDLDAKGGPNAVSQPLLVRLLDGGPFLPELGIVSIFQKALESLSHSDLGILRVSVMRAERPGLH